MMMYVVFVEWDKDREINVEHGMIGEGGGHAQP